MSVSPHRAPLCWRTLANDLEALSAVHDLEALSRAVEPIVIALGGEGLALCRVVADVPKAAPTLLASAFATELGDMYKASQLEEIAREALQCDHAFAVGADGAASDAEREDAFPRAGADRAAEEACGIAYPFRRAFSLDLDLVLFSGSNLNLNAEAGAQRQLLADTFRRMALTLAPPPGPLALTQRQRACLRAVEQGRKSIEIGAALQLAPKTVDAYLAAAKARLGARNRTAAVVAARRLGLL